MIRMSLGVAPANFPATELFCRNRFGDAAIDMGFERCLVLDCATGQNTNSIEEGPWFMSNSECIIEESSTRSCKRDRQARKQLKNCVSRVERPEEGHNPVKAIGSMEVVVTCEDPNVLELDECRMCLSSCSSRPGNVLDKTHEHDLAGGGLLVL